MSSPRCHCMWSFLRFSRSMHVSGPCKGDTDVGATRELVSRGPEIRALEWRAGPHRNQALIRPEPTGLAPAPTLPGHAARAVISRLPRMVVTVRLVSRNPRIPKSHAY